MGDVPHDARYALTGEGEHWEDEESWGWSREAIGIFTPVADDERRVELRGCAPEGRLRRCLDHIGGKRARAGNAWLTVLAPPGREIGTYFVSGVTCEAVRPSAGGAGLLDLTVRLWSNQLIPGSDRPWELVRTGRLDRTGLWHALDQQDRLGWLSVALKHHGFRGIADDSPGAHYELDGRYVTDIRSFYCAIGEAVNGPGGYFGWNLDALNDCLRGGWGATAPFVLEWDHSEVARSHLAKKAWAGAETDLYAVIMEILDEHGVEVVLR